MISDSSTAARPTAPDAPVDLGTLLRDLQQRLQAMSRRLSEAQINSVYATAYNLLQQGSIDRADRLFGMLIALRPNCAKYWHAVGICRRRKNDFAFAVEALGRAFELDPASLECGLLQVEAMMLMERRAEAAELLARVEALAREHADAISSWRAEGFRELLERPAS
ncbi:hypothetical protein [Variovorax soli]|uniref:Zn-dependent protease n=1 Tax=Variovorax soli TaxID=376815 RepID=A0ABU1NFY9_9BURK|nr:hypothetical protein [Variovorax soli]MDR6536925.1 putative Zn-dependent protease [Variovorax soli]